MLVQVNDVFTCDVEELQTADFYISLFLLLFFKFAVCLDLFLAQTFLSKFTGSMRTKRLVKKILSPIFKSSPQEEEISNQASSPVGEVLQNLESSDDILSQRLVDIDALLFAREITLIDKELFIRIPWPELSNCGWMTKDKVLSLPNLVSRFFSVKSWASGFSKVPRTFRVRKASCETAIHFF